MKLGLVVLVTVLVTDADGHREILGIDVSTAEDGAGWLTFLRDLTARGLSGVGLVTAAAHRGLTAAIGATTAVLSLDSAELRHPRQGDGVRAALRVLVTTR